MKKLTLEIVRVPSRANNCIKRSEASTFCDTALTGKESPVQSGKHIICPICRLGLFEAIGEVLPRVVNVDDYT